MIGDKSKKEFNNIILEIKNNILFCEYKEDKINLKKAYKIISDRYDYTGGEVYPAMIRSINKIEIEKEARAFFNSKKSTEGLSAIAMISTNSYSLIMMNFMIRLYRPNIPIKMFTDEKKAIKWLSPFIQK